MLEATPKFLPEKYLFLKRHLNLDLLELDEELTQISVLVQEANECASVANEIKEAAKDSLNLVIAIISSELRKASLPNGKSKSETQIESEYVLDSRYQAARVDYGNTRLDSDLWHSIVEGLRTKSSALRATADLISSGFLTQNYILDKRRVEIRKAGG